MLVTSFDFNTAYFHIKWSVKGEFSIWPYCFRTTFSLPFSFDNEQTLHCIGTLGVYDVRDFNTQNCCHFSHCYYSKGTVKSDSDAITVPYCSYLSIFRPPVSLLVMQRTTATPCTQH